MPNDTLYVLNSDGPASYSWDHREGDCPLCGENCRDAEECLRIQGMKRQPEPVATPRPDKSKGFHDHLDVCQQCANHPFSLCANGARLLRESA